MPERAYTLDNPQTLEEFLAKYKDAINSKGQFTPGKANLNYDDLDAATVYKQEMGGYTLPGYSDPFAANAGPDSGTYIAPKASVNADWIEDPRAKGWIAQHPKGAAIAGLVLGGVGANMAGLLGGSSTAGTASTAFGGPGSFAGANAVGAGDLALGAMPQVTAGSVGLTGAQAAGLGAGVKNVGAKTGLLDTITNAASSAGKFLKENPTLTQIGMAGLGALAGQDTKTSATSQKDPWAPAQPYLLDNLKKNAAMQEQYAQNPFSQQQKQAYQNSFSDSDNFRNTVAPGLLGFANQQANTNYQRQRPSAVGMGGYEPSNQQPRQQINPFQAPPQGNYGLIDWSQFLPKG